MISQLCALNINAGFPKCQGMCSGNLIYVKGVHFDRREESESEKIVKENMTVHTKFLFPYLYSPCIHLKSRLKNYEGYHVSKTSGSPFCRTWVDTEVESKSSPFLRWMKKLRSAPYSYILTTSEYTNFFRIIQQHRIFGFIIWDFFVSILSLWNCMCLLLFSIHIFPLSFKSSKCISYIFPTNIIF